MAARATMAGLITLVRGLIDDPSGVSAVFTDEEIQSALDAHRSYSLRTALLPLAENDGSQKRFQSDERERYWEADVILTSPAGTVLTPSSSDFLAGYFTFGTSQSGVYATGFNYDVYASAADILVLWAGRIEQEIVKFSADGSSFDLGSTREAKLRISAIYRAKSGGGVKSVRMIRDD